MKPVIVFLPIIAATLLGTGCVAFNMGAPDKKTYEFRAGKAKPTPLDRETIDVGPTFSRKTEDDNYVVDAAIARALGLDKVVAIPAGAKTVSVPRELANKHGVSSSSAPKPPKGEELGKIDIGLAGTVLVRQQTGDVYHDVTITKQNRMSFGFFPWGAEYFHRPKGSLEPMVGWRQKSGTLYEKDTNNRVTAVYFGGAIATPFTLLFTPFFGRYECHSHHWKGNIGILDKLTPADREKIDINVRSTKNAGIGEFAHCSWLGFHKYQTIVIGPETSGRIDGRTETERHQVKVPGPYKIEFRIPSLGYRKIQSMAPGETIETFLLPPVEEDMEVESKIRFLPAEATSGTIADKDALTVFDAAQGKTFSRSVKLYASASAGSVFSSGVSTQVVVHVKAPSAPFKTEKRKAKREGWTIYRVTILDDTMTAFDINKLAKPSILSELRNEYASNHPDAEARTIHAHVSYVTDPSDEQVLVYSGVAFAVQPVDRMEYDAGTRRGTIRLRVSDYLDLKAARAWARENIEKIVAEKNVIIESGNELPSGAKYKSLDEVLESGILTIHFEAVN